VTVETAPKCRGSAGESVSAVWSGDAGHHDQIRRKICRDPETAEMSAGKAQA
jgi:hypothetical protein